MSAVLIEPSPVVEGALYSLREKRDAVVTNDGDWKIIRSAHRDHFGSWDQMLVANSTMPPRLKYALVPGTREAELRAECLAWERTLVSSCAGYGRDEFLVLAEDDTGPAPKDAETWIELCDSAGWKAEVRAGNTVVVPLSSGRHIRINTSESDVRAVVELGEVGDSTSASARELLLLTLAHQVRMVRPLLRGRGAGPHTLAEIEIGFRRMPEAEEWSHALESLAFAAAACAEVFDAFADEDLARQYLAIRQPQTRRPVQTPNQERNTQHGHATNNATAKRARQ